MRKKLICVTVVLILTFVLSGCAARSSSIVLTEVEDTPAKGLSTNEDQVAMKTGDPSGEEVLEGEKQPEEPETEPQLIAVYVCGAVNSPGVYELEDGSRICDALDAAGGFTGDADENYVNLAARLSDGTKLLIPTEEETARGAVIADTPSFDSGTQQSLGDSDQKSLVNINTATKEELKSIPGIGDGIAGKIVRYREEKGSFKSCEDIMKVSGIKEKLFSKIRDYITV